MALLKAKPFTAYYKNKIIRSRGGSRILEGFPLMTKNYRQEAVPIIILEALMSYELANIDSMVQR